jgi:periplasmic divalent cation tolerance protein
MTDHDCVIVLTTIPAAGDSAAFANALVGERLAACVNLHAEMASIYRWEGAIERENERQVVIKTGRARLPALKARLIELHPYELPEFLVLSADGSAEYLAWVHESTRP